MPQVSVSFVPRYNLAIVRDFARGDKIVWARPHRITQDDALARALYLLNHGRSEEEVDEYLEGCLRQMAS